MSEKLHEGLKTLFKERWDNAAVSATDLPKFKKLDKNKDHLAAEINTILEKSGSPDLFTDYEEVVCSRDGVVLDQVYLRGLKDGLNLIREIENFDF